MKYEQRRFSFGSSGWSSAVVRIMIATVAAYLVQIMLRIGISSPLLALTHPSELQGDFFVRYLFTAVGSFTYMFLHSTETFSHIFWNMIWLYFFGGIVEEVIGKKSFIRLYLGCGVLAAVIWHIGTALGVGERVVIGASGAVFGISVAAALVKPNQEMLFMFVLKLKLKWLVLAHMVATVFMLAEKSQTSHLTHLGGAIAGFLMIWLFHRECIVLGLQDLVPGGSGGGRTRKKKTKKYRKPPLKMVPKDDEEDEGDGDPFQQIDPILDKIGRHGMKSLTPKEKRLLDKARKRLK